MLFVRLVASPVLPPTTTDALQRRFAADDSLMACVSDADVSATICSLAVREESLVKAVKAIAETLGAAQASGRAVRIELQHPKAASAITDEAVRAVAVELHGSLAASVYVARRGVAAGRWSVARPMGWSGQGLSIGALAPTLPFGGSQALGVAIEVGGPQVLAKARLVGATLSPLQMRTIALATGGPDSGFMEVGVYPIACGRDGAFFVVELSDVKRVPLHRVLALLEVEARRYGARLGLGALLSDAPLDVFLDALATHMGVHIARSQVIETHLETGARRP